MASNEKQLVVDDTISDEKETSSPPFLASTSEEIEATFGVNEKALLRKLDYKLLPAVTLLYLLSFLDRSNGKCSRLHYLYASSITII